jgi:peptide chain release factor subunit 1
MAGEKEPFKKITAKDKYHIKHMLKELEGIRGHHTELITVFIPAGYDINGKINQLQQEQGTATNIKSKTTRDNVIASLEKMVQFLRGFKKTPPNGVMVFSGNAAEREGQQDYRVWVYEPPFPLNQNLYRCDKEFVLDPLRDIIEDKILFGLVAMDKREGNIAMLKGKSIIHLKTLNSAVPGKTKSGGQSAQRFERLRDGAAVDFYKRIAEVMKEEFLDNQTELQGIIVGGPGFTKFDFVDGGYINETLRRKIIAVKDISYTGEFGITELVERSADVLADEEVTKEKTIMREFFELLSKASNKVAYGYDDVIKYVQMGAVDTILVSEEMEDDKVEVIEKEAELMGSKIEIISVETREGVQLKEMGKIVAILRYAVE